MSTLEAAQLHQEPKGHVPKPRKRHKIQERTIIISETYLLRSSFVAHTYDV